MRRTPLIYLFLLILVVSSCEKTIPPIYPVVIPTENNNVFELHIEYWNNDGNTPKISFDSINSSPEIRIDFEQTFTGTTLPPPSENINVLIDNVRIIDANNINYEIDSIKAYEYRYNGEKWLWQRDYEALLSYSPIEDIAVILVLDVSQSLGTDFPNVKTFATAFASNIFSESPSARVGIVDFAGTFNYFPLSNNFSSIQSYISNLQQGGSTILYEAMNKGIEELQNTQAEGKAMLTFTDGFDNASNTAIYSPAYLIDKLEDDPNYVKVNSFTIGLDGLGQVEKPILRNLAVNGGVAEFPETITELEEVFERFSGSISNVYSFKYERSNGIILKLDARQIKFEIYTHPK